MNGRSDFTTNKHCVTRSQILQRVIYILIELLLRVYLVCQKLISNLRTIYKSLFYPVEHWIEIYSTKLCTNQSVQPEIYMQCYSVCIIINYYYLALFL
jgi:hypothetical protein